MKVSMVMIHPRINDEWEVVFQDLDGDRKLDKWHTPNALGFYYYPSTVSPTKAFNALKKCMIARHREEIKKLSRSLVKLGDLKMNTKQSRDEEWQRLDARLKGRKKPTTPCVESEFALYEQHHSPNTKR